MQHQNLTNQHLSNQHLPNQNLPNQNLISNTIAPHIPTSDFQNQSNSILPATTVFGNNLPNNLLNTNLQNNNLQMNHNLQSGLQNNPQLPMDNNYQSFQQQSHLGNHWPSNPLDIKAEPLDSSKDSISPVTSTNPGHAHLPSQMHAHMPPNTSSSLISALGQAANNVFPGLNGLQQHNHMGLSGVLDPMLGGQGLLDSKKRVNSGKLK